MRYFFPLLFCWAMSAAPIEARAQQLPTPGEAIGRVFEGAGLRRAPDTPPDFVVNSRPQNMDYAPLSVSQPADRGPKKTPAELEAMGADLMRAAAENREKAARIKVPDSGRPNPAVSKKSATVKQRGATERVN